MTGRPQERVNFRPLQLVTALRAGIGALLVAFGAILFLSFGRKEEEPVRISVSEPSGDNGEKVVDLSDIFFITGTKGNEESFRLRADQVTGFVGDRKLLKGVHLEVKSDDGQRITLSGNGGAFDLADKRAQLQGDVLVEGKNGFRLKTSSLFYDGERDMIFTSDEIAFETQGLSGTGRGLNYLTRTQILKIPADVRVATLPSVAGEAPVEVRSGDMTLALKENEVVFNEQVVLTRGADRFTGNYLKAVLDDDRRHLVSLKSYGQVSATFVSGQSAAPARLETDSLVATFGPDGAAPEKLEAFGNCRLTNQQATATSESLIAEGSLDRIALRGNPVVVDERSRIAAQEIDLHPAQKGLEARGDVKTSLLPATGTSRSAGPSYFSGKEPVYFQAARLVLEDGGNSARYSGSARGWQGDDSIQAQEIVLHFADRRMKAFRNVLCRFVGSVPAGAGSRPGLPPPAIIVAETMEYDQAEGTVHYRDGVKMTRQDSTVVSDRMHVTLSDALGGRRTIARVQAEGSVRFNHLANSGTADRLLYFPDRETAEMQQDAGLAEVIDQTNGRILRGKTLTFDLKGNRVLTETKEGGRTWITLNSKNKDTRGLESKIGH